MPGTASPSTRMTVEALTGGCRPVEAATRLAQLALYDTSVSVVPLAGRVPLDIVADLTVRYRCDLAGDVTTSVADRLVTWARSRPVPGRRVLDVLLADSEHRDLAAAAATVDLLRSDALLGVGGPRDRLLASFRTDGPDGGWDRLCQALQLPAGTDIHTVADAALDLQLLDGVCYPVELAALVTGLLTPVSRDDGGRAPARSGRGRAGGYSTTSSATVRSYTGEANPATARPAPAAR